jgi:hypothetical protein
LSGLDHATYAGPPVWLAGGGLDVAPSQRRLKLAQRRLNTLGAKLNTKFTSINNSLR